MLGLRRINNNVVLCRDGKGRELIAMGKGIGTLPREIPLGEIERTFYDTDESYRQLVAELPEQVLEFAARIVEIARNELPYELSPNAAFTLADHINFAMERARKRIRVKMPLAYDVEQLYPAEYGIAKAARRRIRKEFCIELPECENTGIAMSLLNSKLTGSETEAVNEEQDEQMLEDVTEIVENEMNILVERGGFNYSRYATHMQYLFRRIHTGQAIQSDNLQIYLSLREEFPEIAACVEKIARHISEQWHSELTEEEKLYLILHINRICIKEGM